MNIPGKYNVVQMMKGNQLSLYYFIDLSNIVGALCYIYCTLFSLKIAVS